MSVSYVGHLEAIMFFLTLAVRSAFLVGLCLSSLLTGGPRSTRGRAASFSKGPELLRANPSVAAEGTAIVLEGHRIGADPKDNVRVVFLQEDSRLPGRAGGLSDSQVNDRNGLQHLGVIVPAGLMHGPCQVIVETNGLTSGAIMIQIVPWVPAVLDRLSPLWAGPGETVYIDGSAFNVSDKVELSEASGEKHLMEAGPPAWRYSSFTVPKDLSEGQYLVRVLNAAGGDQLGSNSLALWVSAGPLPFDILDDWLKPAGPGQWLDLIASNNPLVAHADRVDVAFRQGSTLVAAKVSCTTVYLRTRIPPTLAPGEVAILNRTWAGDFPSFWSEPVPYQILDRPAPPVVDAIELGRKGAVALLVPGPDRPGYFTVTSGESLVLVGTFPVASDNRLRIEFYNSESKITARVSELPGCRKMKVNLPPNIKAGEWRLAVRSLDDNVLVWLPVTMRVEPGAGDR